MIYQNYIWDFDGTLIDTYPLMVKAFKKALNEMNKDASEKIIHKQLKKSSSVAFGYFNLDENFRKRWKRIERQMDKSLAKPFDGIIKLIETLKNEGARHFIITHRDQSTYDFLEHYQMLNLFDDVLTIEQANKRKPDTDMFEQLMSKYALNPWDTLNIGDRNLDMLPAKALNMKTCLYNPRQKVIDFQVDIEVQSYHEIDKFKKHSNEIKKT